MDQLADTAGGMGLEKELQLLGPSSSLPADTIMITTPCIYTEHCTFQRARTSQ